jgi:hypothetical protein
MLLHQLVVARGLERHLSGEHLVEHDAEAVEIGQSIDVLAATLLGRHVGERADDAAVARHALRPLRARDAEIHDLEQARIGEDQVRRLDVAMHDSHLVRIGKAVRRLRDHCERLFQAERRAAFVQDRLERAPAHQLHHHVERAVLLDQRVERRDVGMGQQREVLRLAAEALDEGCVVHQLAAQRLDRHGPVQHGVAPGKDLADPALAQQLQYLELADPACLAHCCPSKAGN